MIYKELFFILFFAVILSLIFSYGFKRSGPFKSFWVFFLIIFMFMWSISVWVPPVHPLIFGVSWMPMLLAGAILALILAIATPKIPDTKKTEDPSKPIGKAKPTAWLYIALSTLFVLFLVVIYAGIVSV